MAVIDGKWLSKEGLTYFWSKIKAIFTKQTETNVIANLGAKNVLKVASTTQTINGVTFTVNDDQTITVNGTASAVITYVVIPNAQAILIPDGDYILSGCPSGGGPTTFDLRWYLYSSGKSAYDQGSGASVTKNGNTASSNIAIVIKSGVTINDLVFKPMIRPVEITDGTFEPYAPSNRELYKTKTEQTETNVIANLGAKNLFPNIATSQTVGGITFTVNDDGTVTANGTKTNSDWFVLSENNILDAGTYTLSDGLPDDMTDCRLLIASERSLSAAIMSTATGVRTQTKTFTTAQTGLYYAIRIASGKTVNNLTFKPMIRRAEITDGTFQPYAPTNRELYETTVTMPQVYGDGTLVKSNSDLDSYTAPGRFYATVAVAQTLAHTPYTSTGFKLVIEKNTLSGTAVFQTLTPTSKTCVSSEYKRVYENGSWSPWYQFTGTQV